MADNPRIEDLRRRVQKDPASIAFAQLAEEYRRARQHQDAVDACSAGLALHPGYLSARVTLGRALIELGDLDRAQRELEIVLKSASENLAAIRGMADIHFKRGEFVEALEFYRRAHGLAPNDPDLEQTVADLTRRVGAEKRPEPKDGLSFDQMRQELAARLPPARGDASAPLSRVAQRLSSSDAAGGMPTLASVPRVVGIHDEVGDRARRTVAALEQWLDAIHIINVTRAHTAAPGATSPHS